MKFFTLVTTALLLAGCSPTSSDYLDVMKKCIERKGQYFTLMIPDTFGPRLAAGCMEPKYEH